MRNDSHTLHASWRMLLTDAALLVRDHNGTGRPSGIQQLETMATELILQELQ